MRCTKLEPGGVSPTYPAPPALLWELGVLLAPRGAAWWVFFFLEPCWNAAAFCRGSWLAEDVQQTQQTHVPAPSRSRFGLGSALGAGWEFGAACSHSQAVPGGFAVCPRPRPSASPADRAGDVWVGSCAASMQQFVLGGGVEQPSLVGILCLDPKAQSPGAGQELQALSGGKSACSCLQGAHSASLGMGMDHGHPGGSRAPTELGQVAASFWWPFGDVLMPKHPPRPLPTLKSLIKA